MASKRSDKDKGMASYMKQHGITRTTMRCPMCHKVIGVTQLVSHLTNGHR